MALVAVLATFLIPLGVNEFSLRGLTHILTCKEQVATPFTLAIPPEGLGPPEILSSTSRIVKGEEEKGLCGGLFVDMGARVGGPGEVAMVLQIRNETEETWQGTVTLQLDETSIPVEIGRIGPGVTAKEQIDFTPPEGSHELAGALLIGP